MCQAEGGKIVPATVVDHITPHKGDPVLFWDSANNWQSLCADHHSRHKQQIEARGYHDAIDADGLPLDPNHPFNRGSTYAR